MVKGKYYNLYQTELGILTIGSDGERITQVLFGDQREAFQEKLEIKLIAQTIQQLNEYFAGKRMFFDIPYYAEGTEFQKKVWNELCRIPYGQTRSYGEIARNIQNPGASRAVGMANNKNPIAIIIPCHRVIGSNGSLTGYGGGMEKKEILLAKERKIFLQD